MSEFKVKYSMRGCLIEDDDFEIVKKAMCGESLSGCGPYTVAFEEKFAKYCGVPHATAVSNGTVALDIAAMALGLKEGDEVLTSAISFMATGLAPMKCGATVKFVDLDPRTLNIDVTKIEPMITEKTKAIFLVHLGGQMCDMDEVMRIAKKYNLKVVEDSAHAPGAEYKGRKAGTIGDIGTFSFHTWKNMCTLGEGGMVVCKDDELYDKIVKLRAFGCVPGPFEKVWDCTEGELPCYQDFMRVGDFYGSNYRLSDVQCAMGLTQLDKLDRVNDLRRRFAARLDKGLEGVEEISVPYVLPECKSVYHLYNIQFHSEMLGVGKKALLKPLMEEYGVQCWIQYVPCYLFHIHREKGSKPGDCPVAENIFRRELISLPIGPTMPLEQADYITDSIKAIIAKIKAGK